MSKTLEDQETPLEVINEKPIQLNESKLDAIMAFADKAERVGAALDTIRKFVLARALPGDWVQHGETINLTGPGAERVINALGLTGQVNVAFTGWHYWKDEGVDKNGKWFMWWYEANVDIGGLHIEKVQGRAGSRDKFFGYENNAWKDLGDVKEADIRMAARRAVLKEGIKVALGLRGIPASSAQALGLDVTKIKKVVYGSGGGGGASATPPAKAGTPLLINNVGQRNTKKDGSGKTVFIITDEKDVKYETFSETMARSAKAFFEAKKKVIFDWEANGSYAPKLKSLVEANDSQPDPEPEDDKTENA